MLEQLAAIAWAEFTWALQIVEKIVRLAKADVLKDKSKILEQQLQNAIKICTDNTSGNI